MLMSLFLVQCGRTGFNAIPNDVTTGSDGGPRATVTPVVSDLCSDGLLSDNEADIDCGEHCGTGCTAGQRCQDDGDCASLVCDALLCAAPNCRDGVLNGREERIDCGGDCDACHVCERQQEVSISECRALESLYITANGSNWTTRTNWMETPNPCSWFGVSCERGQVTHLSLPANNVVGPIDAALTELKNLNELNFSFNQVSFTDFTWLSSIRSIRRLDFTSNQLPTNVVDGLLAELYRHRVIYSFASPTLEIAGTNEAPSGHAIDPSIAPGLGASNGNWRWQGARHLPIQGTAMAYDLEHDVGVTHDFSQWVIHTNLLTLGLVAYYPFDETPDQDGWIGQRDAVCEGGCPSIESGGRLGSALSMVGGPAHLRVPYESAFVMASGFTVAGWVLHRTLGRITCIFTKPHGPGEGNSWSLCTDSLSRPYYYTCSPQCARLSGSMAIEANDWYHLAGTFDGTTSRFYVDGVEVDSHDDTVDFDGTDLVIGGDANSSEFDNATDGLIDELRLYGRPLSSEEIQALAAE